jgi:membrane protein DedA with SNARE-associated domain
MKYDKLINRLLTTYPRTLLLTFRFVPGIRTPTPVIVGMHLFPAREFCTLNVIAAAIWAIISCGVGYFFGLQLVRAAHFVGLFLVVTYAYLVYLVHKRLQEQ